MPVIHCKITEEHLHGDNVRWIEGVVATCSLCNHQTQSFGTGEASILRCLAMLREDCPLGQSNFYTNQENPMPIKLPPFPTAGNDQLPSAGSHLAVCCIVIHMGSQPYEWEDEKGVRTQLQLGFELKDQYRDNGSPFFPIRRTYSFSMHPNSHLRSDLKGWLGRDLGPADLSSFEFDRLIGRTAMLGLIHNPGRNGRTYANISSILKVPHGTPETMDLESAAVVLNPFEFNPQLFAAQPDWLRVKLLAAEEYRLAISAPALAKPKKPATDDNPGAGPLPDDDIPF